ncbi:DUF4190 domain-containing protein [Streptomyces sp. NPDC014636]|uniref:DUF4190 domain-containing protein n=1 Tax=Streptomyces sp. NPDC014636 TaxID=3364876 RepID=UPI0036F6F3B2
MSDKEPRSTPAQQTAGHRSAIPPVSLDKGAVAPAADEAPVRDAAPAPGSGPVHDQQTLTSLPTPSAPLAPTDAAPAPWASPTDAAPAPWASPTEGTASPAPAQQPNPFAPPASVEQPNPFAPPASVEQPNPFAPPASAQQPNPFAPPAPTPAANPFAPPAPASAAPANPFAPPASPASHGGAEPVPPPPIAPGGPGQVPYGYPGTTPTYGYPGAPHAPYPAGHGYGYGWPGMQPVPSNGMGTASLVLGILSAVGFLLWPIAMVLGILAVIFGALGRGKASRREATNPGVALAGLICGAAGLVLAVGFFVLVIVVNT